MQVIIKIKITKERTGDKYHTNKYTGRRRCTNLMSKLVSFMVSLNLKVYD